ncbi:MAG: HAMP domain-containing protein [Microgenomates group bacterium]|jgi:nitrogen fixation/metabolism regulation signal transduction histidine kinase
MKIRTKIFLAVFLGIIPVLIIGIASIIALDAMDKRVSAESTQNIQNLSNTVSLNSIAQFTRYYDEVLTQSARNYAFTGDKKWKDRYLQISPELDNQIQQALELGDNEDKRMFASIDLANLALVNMETKAIDLVDNGKKTEAVKILDGEEYSTQKEIYKNGLTSYIEKQGRHYDDVLIVSTDNLNNNFLYIQHALDMGIFYTSIAVIITVLIAVILAIIIARLIVRPVDSLSEATKQIIAGNLQVKVNIKSNDEIGELAKNFNEMSTQLQSAKENIESRVINRTKELEKTNNYMVGRELKMIELKKKIMEMESKK